MNVSEVDATKLLIAFIQARAVAAGDPLENHIFTEPNEWITNDMKEFCSIGIEADPDEDELGDTQAKTIITWTITFGRRDDVLDDTGTEKETNDSWAVRYAGYLRSLTFKEYMTENGLTVPGHHITRTWDEMMRFGQEFLRVSKMTMKMISYQDNYY